MELKYIPDAGGERIDKALAAHFEQLSRTQLQDLIRDGQVTVNGNPVKSSYRVIGGEQIVVRVEVQEETEPQPEAITLDVVYEDDQVAVINKPAGMVVHPAVGHMSGTLVNAILSRWPQIAEFGEMARAGIVHRLDKETSGAILIAKTVYALEDLREQFKNREIRKRYVALVDGTPDTPEGVIDAPIGRDPHQRKRMAVVHDGREAITEYHLVEEYAEQSLLDVFPKTGRTHQIRVHLAFIGHPVVGDNVYGPRKQRIKMKRHFLHAASITFEQPETGERITVEAPLPVGLREILNKLPR